MSHRLSCLRVFACLLVSLLASGASFGQCSSVAYARQIGSDATVLQSLGSLLFLGQPGLVEIHDLTEPGAPLPISAIPVDYEPTTITANGSLLYITTWDFIDGIGKLVIVDIAVPAAPTVLADITWNDEVADSAAGVDRLCLLNDAGEIRILDVTSPGQPIIGNTLSGREFESVEVRQSVLYATFIDSTISPARAQLRTWSVSAITSPSVITTIDLGEASASPRLDRMGTTLAAVAATRLSIFSLTTPGVPSLLGVSDGARAGATPHLAEHGGVVLCHLLANGFAASVWDVTNPAIPTLQSTYAARPRPLTAIGEHAYLFDSDRFTVYSFVDPAAPQPVWVRDYGLPSRCFDLHASGTVLGFPEIAAVSPERFTLVDFADSGRPEYLGSIDVPLPRSLGGSDIDGARLGFLTRDGGVLVYTLHLYDIANPASPVLESDDLVIECTSIFANNELYLDGRTGVIEFENEVVVLDFAAVGSPRIASRIATPGSGWAYFDDGLVVRLNTSGTASVSIYDVTNPDRPVLASTSIDEPNAIDISVAGRMVAVLRQNGSTALYDLADPSSPNQRSTITRPASMSSVSYSVLTDSFCVISGSGRQSLYSLGNPATPVLLGEYALPNSAYRAERVNQELWMLSLGGGLHAVTLPELPILTEQPLDQAPCPGSTLVLNADAVSDTAAAYRWKYNGLLLNNGPMANGTVASGAFTRTLTLTNFNPLDAGSFGVRFTNTCGSVLSENAIVAAGGLPAFITVPSSREGCPFGSVSFSVTTEFPTDTAVRWQAELPFGSGNYFNLSDFASSEHTLSGTSTPTLTIAARPDGRIPTVRATRYRAVASNACGTTTSTSARLTICGADVNCDLFLDFFDYDEFVQAFESGSPASVADFNGDGFIDFFDYDEFVIAFETGC